MDKDNKIKDLEGKIAQLQKVINQMAKQMKVMQGRIIRNDENNRRLQGRVDTLSKRRH